MTTQTSNYNFMDLLKDHNYVPQVDDSKYGLFRDVTDAFESVSAKFDEATTDYSFMDQPDSTMLLQIKGVQSM